MKEKRKITFGDILDLLDGDEYVTLHDGDSSMLAKAYSKLWRNLKDEVIVNIRSDEDGVGIWLEEEDDHEPEEAS